jgi:hypothetical protein
MAPIYEPERDSDGLVEHRATHDDEASMTLEELTGSMFSAFRYAQNCRGPDGQKLPIWIDLPEEAQTAWPQTVEVATALITSSEGARYVDLARQAYIAYARAVGRGHVRVQWEALRRTQQLAWEAAVRHLANCLSFAEHTAEDIEAHESHWRDWVEKRLEKEAAA